MQPRKSILPWILGCIAVIIICGLCAAALAGFGLLAWLLPVRTNSGPLPDLPTPVLITAQPVPSTPLVVTAQPGSSSALTAIPVYDVRVEIGVGSLIPLDVVVSSEWPSTCAQLAETNIHYNDRQQIQVELLANADASSCGTGQEGLPFIMHIPLNPVVLPAGKYSVQVNGVQADFDWVNSPSGPSGYYPTGAGPDLPGLVPIRVNEAHIETGVGSPIPVDLLVDAGWPSLCSQLIQVKTDLNAHKFTVDLLASPADATCPPDLLGFSYPVRVPLNMTGLPAGSYTISVNGYQASFDWPLTINP